MRIEDIGFACLGVYQLVVGGEARLFGDRHTLRVVLPHIFIVSWRLVTIHNLSLVRSAIDLFFVLYLDWHCVVLRWIQHGGP